MLILGALFWTTTGGGAPPSPPPIETAVRPSGGLWHEELKYAIEGRKSWRQRLEEAKIQRLAVEVLDEVAHRQVLTLELDEHKRFEELERELELKGIEWEARYLDLLNERREALIDAEIGRLLRLKQDENDVIILLTLMGGLI